MQEAGCAGELPNTKVEAGEGGHAEEGAREKDVERKRTVDEDELLDALHGEGLEPARKHARVLIHVAAREVDMAEGPLVRGDDLGHGGGDAPRIFAREGGGDWEDVGVDEDKRDEWPDPVPAARERVRRYIRVVIL